MNRCDVKNPKMCIKGRVKQEQTRKGKVYMHAFKDQKVFYKFGSLSAVGQ